VPLSPIKAAAQERIGGIRFQVERREKRIEKRFRELRRTNRSIQTTRTSKRTGNTYSYFYELNIDISSISFWRGGGGVLPYVAFTVTCLSALNRVGNVMGVCPKQGIVSTIAVVRLAYSVFRSRRSETFAGPLNT